MDGHKTIAAIMAKQNPIIHIENQIRFTSTNQYKYVSLFDANLNIGAIRLQVVQDNPEGKQFLFGHMTENRNNRIQLYLSNGKLCVGLGNNGTLKTNIAALQPNTKYNLALVWNNGSFTVYINGEQKATGTYTGLSQLNTFADIGNSGIPSARTEGFLGTIEDVRIYNRALTAGEINQTVKALRAPENWLIEDTLVPRDLAGNSVSFSSVVAGLPGNAVFDPATNAFSWRPWYDQGGSYELLFSALGSDYTQKLAINVEDVLLKSWYQDWLDSNGVQSAMVEY
ncbi:MAG: LamG domain-containing protein [Phycisphaerae bacterium]|nr:LamG domain-containing protein [Phycisphaerae bacterium]